MKLTVRTEPKFGSYLMPFMYYLCFELNHRYHHMWHTFTIVELLLVVLDFFLFAENTSGLVKFRSVLNVKCFLENTYY